MKSQARGVFQEFTQIPDLVLVVGISIHMVVIPAPALQCWKGVVQEGNSSFSAPETSRTTENHEMRATWAFPKTSTAIFSKAALEQWKQA